MSIYENYTLSINNDKLSYSYLPTNSEIFQISSNSNLSLVKFSALEYNFLDPTFGFSSNNDSIIYRANSNYFNGNVYIDGILNAREFPAKIPILDNFNKIPISYLPDINTGFIYNTDAIGIGTTLPETKLHINNGSAYIQNGRLGIGTNPSFNFHLDKNDPQVGLPAFVISSNNYHIFDIYSEKGTVIINDSNNDVFVDPNIKLNVNGLTHTKSLSVSNVLLSSYDKTTINNTLFLSNISSTNQNKIVIDSNVDLIINNLSVKSAISNISEVLGKTQFADNIIAPTINNNNELSFINNTNRLTIGTTNVRTSNIITSNITLLNYDSLTSNPNSESVFDIKGKIRIYNDTSNVISNIYANDSSLFIITPNLLVTYNIANKNFNSLNLSLTETLFKTKGTNFAFYRNSIINLNNNPVITLANIADFAITNNTTIIYIIDNSGNLLTYTSTLLNFTLQNSRSLPGTQRIIKIDSYIDSFAGNKCILLSNQNNLYLFTGSDLSPFILISGITGTILDFACGEGHTIVLTTTGVFSFGANDPNNSKFYRGYSTAGSQLLTTQALEINFLKDKSIVKVKAFRNSSIVIDKDGYVYIFGYINRLYDTIMIYKIDNLNNIIDFCCTNNDVFLLSYFNDIFTLNEPLNNNSKLFLLPDYFYGTSIKSRGSIVIGGNNFYTNQNNQTTYLPKNSLLVENFVGIGSNIIGNPKYSMIISGNINIQNGSIYYNDQLFIPGSNTSSGTTTTTSIITTTNYWNKLGTDLYYIQGGVGIGTQYPRDLFHLNGNGIIENNLTVYGKLTTNEYKPFIINKEKDIYYNGKIGINKNFPISTLDIYDGDFRITNVIELPQEIILNNPISIDILNNNLNTPYINPIAINSTGELIINSYYNNDPNNNNNTVRIYKYDTIAKQWVTQSILGNFTTNNYYGQTFAISDSGSRFFIGAFNQRSSEVSSRVIGGIYQYRFNTNNQPYEETLITYLIPFNINNIYYKIGLRIACSGDGNILISTIYDYNKLLYINNINTGQITLLNFNTYDLYHSSFNQIINQNQFNPKTIYIESNKDGSLILINYIYDPLSSGVPIINYQFFNCYLIKNNEIFFIKYPSGYQNSFITSLGLTSKGTRIFISTQSGNHFVFDVEFMNINYKITKIPNVNVDIKYYDISPSYVINLRDIDSDYDSSVKSYRGKISKSGTNIYLGNYRRLLNYKLNNITNEWVPKEIISNINNLPNINNYNYDIDYNGHKVSVSYIYKLVDGQFNDTIQLQNKLVTLYSEETSLYLYNSNLNINVDTRISSNLYANKIYGDGSNISNIQLTNIVSEDGNYEILYLDNKKIKDSSNFIWNNTSNYLYTNGDIYLTKNLETYSGSIKSGSNIYVTSNIYVNSNIYAFSNLYVSNETFINSNLNVQSNIYGNSSLFINGIISANNGISCLYGSINSGIDIISSNNIKTISGSIESASNIIAFNDIISKTGSIISASNIETINGSIISMCNIISSNGIIKSGSDLIASSNIIGYSNLIITSNIYIQNGGLESKGDIKTLNGNLISILDIIGNSNLIINSNITTLYGSIISGSNIYTNYFYGNGSNISNILVENVIGAGLIKYGGTGRSYFNSNGLLIGNGNDGLNVTSNLYWDNQNEKLIFSNNSSFIINSTAPIINIPFLLNSHFAQNLNISNGGTGNSNFNNNSLIFYSSNTSNLISSSNLYWSNDTLYVNGNIYGNGSNITNINPLNIIDRIPVIKGGTGNDNFDIGNVLFGNGILGLISTSNLNWDNNTNTLNISNVNIRNNLIVNGSNASNVDANKIVNIVGLKNGGLGVSNINPNEFIFGFDNTKISSSSNVKWNETNKIMEIDTNLFSSNIYSCNFVGNGFNVSNLDIAKIGGIMPITKGGLGFSSISKNNFIYANNDNSLAEATNIKWFNEFRTFKVIGDIDIGNSNFYGNGYNIANINTDNFVGIVNIARGGTGNNEFPSGRVVFSGANNLTSTANLVWDNTNIRMGIGKINPTSTLDINGLLKTNSLQIASTVIGTDGNITVGTSPNGRLDVLGLITSDEISIGTSIISGQRLIRTIDRKIGINNSDPRASLHVTGNIICDGMQIGETFITASGGIQSGLGDISTVSSGILASTYGGTGLSNLSNNQLLVGSGKGIPVYQTPNLTWNIDLGRLGIGTPTPSKKLDVNGDINFAGNIFSNNDIIPSIDSINFSQDTRNILFTNKQFYIGYSNNDTYKLKVNGNVFVSGYITGLSDIRYKTNITDIIDPLEKVKQLKGVYYNFINDDKRSIGLIAQEVETIIPEVVYTNTDNTKSIAYGNMVALLIESIKELTERIKKLEEKL